MKLGTHNRDWACGVILGTGIDKVLEFSKGLLQWYEFSGVRVIQPLCCCRLLESDLWSTCSCSVDSCSCEVIVSFTLLLLWSRLLSCSLGTDMVVIASLSNWKKIKQELLPPANSQVEGYIHIHTYLHFVFLRIVGNAILVSPSVHTNWKIDNKVDWLLIHKKDTDWKPSNMILQPSAVDSVKASNSTLDFSNSSYVNIIHDISAETQLSSPKQQEKYKISAFTPEYFSQYSSDIVLKMCVHTKKKIQN